MIFDGSVGALFVRRFRFYRGKCLNMWRSGLEEAVHQRHSGDMKAQRLCSQSTIL